MQFRLKTLLLLFVVVWTSMAAFGPAGIFLTVFVITVVLAVRVAVARGAGWASVSLCALLLLLGLCLLLPAVSPARAALRRAMCINNLKQIAIALRDYESQYGCLPPAYVADAQGRPMHSWRVLLLPFLGEKARYSQYRFDEPWNGPNNRKLAAQMPEVYRCPSDPGEDAGSDEQTSYLAVVGPGTAWPGSRGRRRAEIRDDPASTILLVEAADLGIRWMEPRDLTLDEALGNEPPTRRVPSSRHAGSEGYFVRPRACAGYVVMVDCIPHFFVNHPSRETMAALLRVDGGPVTPEDMFYRPPPPDEPLWDRLNWSHCIGLPLYVLSLLALLCRPLPEKWRAKPTKQP